MVSKTEREWLTTTEWNDKSETKAGGLEEHKATGKSNLSLKFCAFVGTILSDDEPALEVGAEGRGGWDGGTDSKSSSQQGLSS